MGADHQKNQAMTSRQLKSCHPSGFAGDGSVNDMLVMRP